MQDIVQHHGPKHPHLQRLADAFLVPVSTSQVGHLPTTICTGGLLLTNAALCGLVWVKVLPTIYACLV